jgi:hypothetical protein
MIAAGHEDCDDVQRRRPYEPNYPSRSSCRLARVGPYRARWDRSLSPELRAAAAAHYSRHGRHRRSQQELALLRGDSHYCAEPPRWCCREPCAATTPWLRQAKSSLASRRHPWAPTCASSSPTLEGRGRALYEKCSGPRENLIEDMERLDPVPACARWQANQFPAHRASTGCCARHQSVRAGWSHLRDDQAHVGEDRRPRRANDRCGTRRGKPSLQPQNAFRLSLRLSPRGFVPPAAHDLRRWLADAEADCVGLEARRGSRGYRSHP